MNESSDHIANAPVMSVLLRKQYDETADKEKIDYWTPLTELILEFVRLRGRRDLSQADIARRMRTTQSVISRFENIGRKPNYDFLVRIAQALGHRLSISLQGEFTVTAHEKHHALITRLAQRYHVDTSDILEKLLDGALQRESENELPISASVFHEARNSEPVSSPDRSRRR